MTRIQLKTPALLAFVAFASIVGCERTPTAEELHADAVFQSALQAEQEGRLMDARHLFLDVMELDRITGREARLASASEHLAGGYKAGARFDSSFFFYERSFEHYRSVADKYSARRVRLAKASLHRQLGEDQEALTLIAEMSRIAEVLGDAQGVTELNWHLVPLLRTLGRQDEEQNVLTQLLNEAATAGNPAMQARVYTEWGASYNYRREFNAAAENFLRAFTLAGQAGDSLQAVFALSRLARAYNHAGLQREAFETFTDALLLSDRTKGAGPLREEMLINVGNIYLSAGQFDDAERFYSAALQSAIARNDKLTEGYLWLQLGHCHVGRRPRSAESWKNYQIALDLFTSFSYTPGISYARASYGIGAMKGGRTADALENLSKAVHSDPYPGRLAEETDIPLECEKAFYRLHGVRLNEAYLEALLVLGKYQEAFVEADRERAMRLAETAGQISPETGGQEITASLWEIQHNEALRKGALRQLGTILSSSPENRSILQEAAHGWEKYRTNSANTRQHLAEAENKRLSLLVNQEGGTIDAVQRSLPDNSVLLTYVPTARSTFVFAVGRRNWTVQLSAVPKKRLTELEREFRLLSVDSRTDSTSGEPQTGSSIRRQHELAGWLYGALVWPVESFLPKGRRVIVVPYQDVLPFHALRKLRRASPYFIQEYQVSYLPTAASITNIKTTAPSVIDIVGVGHRGSTSWDVEYELRDIRAFHKDARLHFGKDASISILQNERASVLNLALEFHYDARRPGNSFLRVSNGTPAGSTEVPWGKLLTLPRYPTVLVSDLGSYEGIPSIKPLLFLVNGSESVILTSSPVQRKTKKYFGELFYTAVVGGRAGDDAYRDAMLGMIGNPEMNAVFLWAPFYRWGI